MKCRKPALEKCESNKECSPLFFCNEYHICDDSPDKTPYIDYVFFFWSNIYSYCYFRHNNIIK